MHVNVVKVKINEVGDGHGGDLAVLASNHQHPLNFLNGDGEKMNLLIGDVKIFEVKFNI